MPPSPKGEAMLRWWVAVVTVVRVVTLGTPPPSAVWLTPPPREAYGVGVIRTK